MKTRDISKAQFEAKCAEYGFKAEGFWGYYSIGVGGVRVSIWNAGERRRTQLAYLIQERDRWTRKLDQERLAAQSTEEIRQ